MQHATHINVSTVTVNALTVISFLKGALLQNEYLHLLFLYVLVVIFVYFHLGEWTNMFSVCHYSY